MWKFTLVCLAGCWFTSCDNSYQLRTPVSEADCYRLAEHIAAGWGYHGPKWGVRCEYAPLPVRAP